MIYSLVQVNIVAMCHRYISRFSQKASSLYNDALSSAVLEQFLCAIQVGFLLLLGILGIALVATTHPMLLTLR